MNVKLAIVSLLGGVLLVATPSRGQVSPELLRGAVGFAAKEGCSCRFVVGQSEAYCKAFAQPPLRGATVSVAFDDAGRTATATLALPGLTVTRLARMTPDNGCLLDRPSAP